MIVIRWEPEIAGYTWGVTGRDRQYLEEIYQQTLAIDEGWA